MPRVYLAVMMLLAHSSLNKQLPKGNTCKQDMDIHLHFLELKEELKRFLLRKGPKNWVPKWYPTLEPVCYISGSMPLHRFIFESIPNLVTLANQVYKGSDSLLKMLCHPGGDWHPGWGVDPRICFV